MAEDESPEDRVQMNVRVPRWLREQIDTRRQILSDRHGVPFSRDKWVENAARRALQASTTVTDAGTATATPPHRRGSV